MENNISFKRTEYPTEPSPTSIMVIVHAVLVFCGFIINIIHVCILSKITLRAGCHYKAYLLAIAFNDTGAFFLRALSTNHHAQRLFHDQKMVCATSCIIHQMFMMGHGTLFLMISCDRLNAFRSPHNYSFTFLVKHYIVVIIIVHVISIVVCVTYGVGFYEQAFSVKGVGVCKIDNVSSPYLAIPFTAIGVLIIFIITGNCIYILIRQRGFAVQINGQALETVQHRAAEVNKTISLVLLLKYMSWVPFLGSHIIRASNKDSEVSDWILLELSVLFNMMLPYGYGLRTTEYRRYLHAQLHQLFSYCVRVSDNNRPVDAGGISVGTVETSGITATD